MKHILFDKTKSNHKVAFVFLLLSFIIGALLLVTRSFYFMTTLCVAMFTLYLSIRYFSYHKHTYLKYDQSALYVYCGLFRKLKSVQYSTVSIIMIMESKIKLYTKDGIEVTLNCLEMSKQDVVQLKSYLRQYITQEKWAL